LRYKINMLFQGSNTLWLVTWPRLCHWPSNRQTNDRAVDVGH